MSRARRSGRNAERCSRVRKAPDHPGLERAVEACEAIEKELIVCKWQLESLRQRLKLQEKLEAALSEKLRWASERLVSFKEK